MKVRPAYKIHKHLRARKGQDSGRSSSPSGQPGLRAVTSSAGDKPALNRTCCPGMGSGIIGIFRLVLQSVASKRGLRKAASL